MAEPQILTDADLKLLNQTLQGCQDWRCILTKMRNSGLDTADMEAELNAQEKVAAGLKAQFFPHHP